MIVEAGTVDEGVLRGGRRGGAVDEEQLGYSMRVLEIAHFAEVGSSRSDRAILLYCAILP